MNKRAKEVALEIWKIFGKSVQGLSQNQIEGSSVYEFVSSLPEFKEQKWIECSDRMPGMTMFTWIYSSVNPHLGALQSFYDNRGFSCAGTPRYHEGITHWMECEKPEAPISKESDLVKSVQHVFHDRYPSMSSCEANTMAEVIDEIKRYEKGNK